MPIRIFFIILIIFGYCCPPVSAGEDARIYATARKLAKAGQRDFAFMQYQILLRDHPASRFTEHALFAKGEYNFIMDDFRQAKEAFQSFLIQYPDSKGRLFAMAYLLRIAKDQNDKASAQDMEEAIITTKQVSLVFRDRKEYQYQSPLNHSFKAAIHIDKIEIYAGGDLFVKISY